MNDILLRSAAVLQQLPALREQHDAAAHAAAAQLLPGQRAEAMAQQLLERRQLAAVGLMLVQLLAYTCTRFDAKTAEEEEEERSSNVSIHASPTHIAQARCAFALQQLPALVQLPLGALAAHAPVLQAGAERRWGRKGSGGGGNDSVSDAQPGQASSNGSSSVVGTSSTGQPPVPAAGAGGGGSSSDSSGSTTDDDELWIEWATSLHHLVALIWCLGAEVDAGAEGASPGTRASGPSPFHSMRQAVEAAAAAARLARAGPSSAGSGGDGGAAPAGPLARPACCARAPRRRGSSTRARPLEGEPGVPHRAAPQGRLPTACLQLLTAADAAASVAIASLRQLVLAAPQLLDLADAACRLLRLACRDAAHWALQGGAAAAARLLPLALSAVSAASSCGMFTAVHPLVDPPVREWARRCMPSGAGAAQCLLIFLPCSPNCLRLCNHSRACER